MMKKRKKKGEESRKQVGMKNRVWEWEEEEGLMIRCSCHEQWLDAH